MRGTRSTSRLGERRLLTAAGALLTGVAFRLLSLLPSAPSEAADPTAWIDNGKPLMS